MAYRLEYASSGRAGCKAPEPCKGTKIDKGALRFGTGELCRSWQDGGLASWQADGSMCYAAQWWKSKVTLPFNGDTGDVSPSDRSRTSRKRLARHKIW